MNIRHAAHTEGSLPDPGETGGWRTQGREPRAVTGATAKISLSYFAEIGLTMLMLLVPFQRRRKQRDFQEHPAGVTQQRQSRSSVPSPAPLPAPAWAGGSRGPAARAGKGESITRKTSMHRRVVSALLRVDFC